MGLCWFDHDKFVFSKSGMLMGKECYVMSYLNSIL